MVEKSFPSAGNEGPATDRHNEPVVDPTKNVLDLVRAAVERLDDLREADAKTLEAESRHLRELMELHANYEDKLRLKETERIDAIRAVDVGAVNRAAEVAATQASALAQQLIATAEASRVQVAAAAQASVTSLAAALEPIQKDIRDLRDAQSRGQGGKEQSTDTRLNVGAVVGALGLLLGVLFAILGYALQ